MSSKNVETLRAAHQAFNRRDFDAVVRQMTSDCRYHDRARNVVFAGPEEFKDNLQGWITAFPDAEVTGATYVDAGNTVIAQFTGRGTNDGTLGPLAATGRKTSFHECEVVRFDDQGRIIGGDGYYDQLTIMVQLGHVEEPVESATD